MRGTQTQRSMPLLPARFIPAHAGNTAPNSPPMPKRTVHPRACGEHLYGVASDHWYTGSSPRMRGTRLASDADHGGPRFIPAHAGNTAAAAAPSSVSPVHPRACGEHNPWVMATILGLGSSPRMRGTLAKSTRQFNAARFIPAHAGNTSWAIGSSSKPAVHPRACGEHSCQSVPMPATDGSSPRMRGTLGSAAGTGDGDRFIPAHAGNTPLSLPASIPGPVHPRACGEHARAERDVGNLAGSSPRMRGTHNHPALARVSYRFIPADAGNTVPMVLLASAMASKSSSGMMKSSSLVAIWSLDEVQALSTTVRFFPS